MLSKSNIDIRPIQSKRELDDMYYQRWLVLRAPLGMDRGSEKDKHDYSAFHLVAVCEEKIIGSARLRQLSAQLGSIAYVAVLSEFRSQGLGTKLIKKLMEQAQEKNLKSLRLMARSNTLGFYHRIGFLEKGEPFNFLGIPHIFMYANLPLFCDNVEDR
ncbi:MAG: GNAT family N-acetyltransferase [Symploca sp. SIO3C6]|uniref:GNAT family N-acetyltransferase n=1 Tax=Symploca sp. SIO1C4 TaxID=2607765 RepID=A0A6B3NMW2_9CYAN|nr:GNAT family N-acetyltransferase [Symploca sp. SIO3C6]NER30548.1 GNAT family N-acetyltransferase [Symploca sp. SIO1C4]NET06682.1 GNAT family N-acetyltransferase [Symploca sp. SIO2B6]